MFRLLPLTVAAKLVGAPGGPVGTGVPSSVKRALLMLMRGCDDPPPGLMRVSLMVVPVACSAASAAVTVAPGSACFRMAQAPATCGAAIDVPFLLPKALPVTEEVMSEPGANSDRKGALLLKLDTSPASVMDPTLTAEEMQPGAPSAVLKALLPPEATTAIPSDRTLSFVACAAVCCFELLQPVRLARTNLRIHTRYVLLGFTKWRKVYRAQKSREPEGSLCGRISGQSTLPLFRTGSRH